jgi:hypothetical protein
LVHWEGYPREEDTWEPPEHLEHAQDLIDKFHADYPNKPAPPINGWVASREDKLEELTKNPKLYHYIFGMPGEGFMRPDKLKNLDIIVPLTPQQAENLLHQPIDPLPHLPSEICRVWIYETEPVNAITMR